MRQSRLIRALIAGCALVITSQATGQFNYSVYDGQFSQLPDFTSLTPIASGTTDAITLSVTSEVDTFGLVFTHTLTVTSAGNYEFETTSDDGSRVYIDGNLVVDNDGLHAPVTVTGNVFLTQGTHSLRVEFFENLGGEVLTVRYRAPGDAFGPIPPNGNLNESAAGQLGQWGPVIAWPHIAISAANLPDGRVLTWSSTETNAFPANREFTHSSVFDPQTGQFINTDSNFHDMFCAGVSTLEDGRIIASGGNPDDRRTSAFNPDGLLWSPLPEMFDLRWYATNVTLPNNEVFSTFGKSAGNRSEKFDPGTNTWTRTPNASMQTLLDEHNSIGNLEWFPLLAVQPNGRVFHGGPTPTFNTFDPVSGGSNEVLGQPTGTRARKWANVVTYDVGKVLLIGGADLRESQRTLTSNVFLADLSGPTPQVTQGPSMNFARALSNSVTLPNGEVLVVGGNTSGINFSDDGAVFSAEIFSPVTNSWRVVDSISIPRTYHSTALLLKDGRVLSAGGGACGGCAVNHLDGQIFSPPYLFNDDGSDATRPLLSGVPSESGTGAQMVVSASADTTRFTMVRLSATTHHVNTDQRFVPVSAVDNGNGTYTLTMNSNPNVLLAGNYWLFAVNAQGTPSIGETVQIRRDFVDNSVDTDGDGFPDAVDAFPNDPNEWADTDGDGVGDNGDAFPNDPSETQDSDGDGVGDNADAFPNDPTETQDSDGDGIGDNADPTPFGNVVFDDGFEAASAWTLNPGGTDTATTGQWEAANAGATTVAGVTYQLPAAATGSRYLVTAGDSGSSAGTNDIDNGITSVRSPNISVPAGVTANLSFAYYLATYSNGTPDDFLRVSVVGSTTQTVLDLRGTPGLDGGAWQSTTVDISTFAGQTIYLLVEAADAGTPSLVEAGIDDVQVLLTGTVEPDSDGDGVPDSEDAFPNDPNESQDSDGDGVGDNGDAFPNDPTETADTDGDGVGDNADAFPTDPNETQDSDGDGVGDNADAFPNDPTETTDTDGDGVGDNADAFPNDPNESQDSDGDGFGDNSDSTPTGGSNLASLPSAPRHSTTLIVETSTGADRLWNVNPDNNTITVSDPAGSIVREIAVGQKPWSLARAPGANRVFVTNKADASISVIDTQSLAVIQTVALPYASQPHGIVFNATGSELYVVLEALARVQKYSAASFALLGELSLGGTPRHIAMSHDDSRLLVSNFITPPVPGENTGNVDMASARAEVFSIDPASMALTTTLTLTHDTRPASESQGPGLPNYLNAPVVTYDNAWAFVPSKKDNINSGGLRGNVGMTFDQSVRTNTSRINLATNSEDSLRIDFDNSSLATGAAMYGNDRYLFVALETSRELAVYDALNGFELMRLPTGRAPQGVALSSDGRSAYVHNFMDRSISRFDLVEMIETDLPASNPLSPISVVANETLSPDILRGKQLFYDAQDDRLARDDYMSCASCHNDGGQDGRVWDFTSLGEGLRNTIELNGRGGLTHGFLHWSANFDEVQDFEGQIRRFSAGTGLTSDAVFNTGTRSEPLGDPLSGLSADLDALAAYVGSLDTFAPSPYRNGDGTLTSVAEAGKAVFQSNNCGACHGGSRFTNSADASIVSDIGTLTGASGTRLGGPLTGIDTPTLRDVWSTGPYLHDGSALTLADAVAAHSGVSIGAGDMDNLVAYLQQIGRDEDAPFVDSDGDGVPDDDDAFPFDPNETQDSDGDGVGDNGDAFPNDPNETQDSDGDGVGDNADAFPNDPNETQDSDGDGVGDNADAFPNDPSETQDSDGDGVGDNADAFPNDPSETQDSDGDGVGDNADAFPNDPTETVDTDGDGVGDNADVFPNDPTETMDSDGDGIGDNADPTPFGDPVDVLSISAADAVLTGDFVLSGDQSFFELPESFGEFYTFDPSVASATFNFLVTTPGVYQIEGLIDDNGGRSDSFFIRVNGAPATPWIWDTGSTAGFAPVRASARNEGVLNLTLAAGANTVTLYARESGTRLGNLRLVLMSATGDPGSVVFSDNFESGNAWTRNPNGTDTATTGLWEVANAEPTSTSGNTMQLDDAVSGVNYLVTAGSAGSSVGTNDIDNGTTSIRSPSIDIPAGAQLSFSYYMAHLNNATSADFLRVSVVGNTTQTVLLESGAGDTDVAAWASTTVDLGGFAGQSVFILVEAADAANGSLIEAGIDDVLIEVP